MSESIKIKLISKYYNYFLASHLGIKKIENLVIKKY